MRRALVFGADGQLGSELMRATWSGGWEPVVAPLADFDFSAPETLEAKVIASKPDALVNAAAYTAVDKAEIEQDLAEKINALAPQALARSAKRLDVPLFHVSTDYVFDGELADLEYTETHPVNPVSAYGRTKERGESLIRAAWTKHFILRTSWVYSSFGTNFVKTMLRLGAERNELRVVGDQTGRPTHAGELASTILRLLSAIDDGKAHYGTYNVAGGSAMTWHAFAEAIFVRAERYGRQRPMITAVTTAEYPTPARRPKNSRLDGKKLLDTYGIPQPSFDAALDRTVAELLGAQ
ncbi:MAG: dTDP-4-dehydrorhamnose reductase [Clostridia bacterium]|nr:dTDP-4-dehydrorhamnose reductase [Deltaproteobacteria bacterium]